MDQWPAFVSAVLDRHGVGDVDLARVHGISANRFYRRTTVEAWHAPLPRIRVHPAASRSVQRDVLTVSLATQHPAGASGTTAAWLHGLVGRPQARVAVATSRPTVDLGRSPGRVVVRRARWLRASDIVTVDGVPTLDLPAMFIGTCALPPASWWGWLIDAVHRDLTTPAKVLERLESVGPVAGRGLLWQQCEYLASLCIESVFQSDVAVELDRLGYGPEFSTRWIPTPDGIGLHADVPLPRWKIAVEPDGDRFHRTREQRRLDRRRDAAFAGIDWVRVPVDWRDWLLDRAHVIAAIDAAIAAQQRRGIGVAHAIPRHG